MSATPQYASTPTVGAAILSIGDKSRTAPANFGTIFTPGALGGGIERIDIQPLGNTAASVLRLFRYDIANSLFDLYMEVPIPALTNTLDAQIPSLTLQTVDYPQHFPIALPANWTLRASINDTQISQDANLALIAASQTLGGAGQLNLNGANVTAANTTAIVAAAALSANVPMTETSTPYVMSALGLVSLTSAGNLSAVNVTILGRGHNGAFVTETIAGPNANTVYSANAYREVLAVVPLSSSGTTMSVGYSAVATGASILPTPSPIALFSGGNLSGVSFTVTGALASGAVTTESIAGPNVGQVTSVNAYRSIFTISTNAAVASGVTVGVPAIVAGIKVQAEGGSY